MSFEMVTVLMPIYKETEYFLRRSIESILAQTYSNFEFIIINDNPSNELSERLISEYQLIDKRIIYIKNERNCGITESLNRGLDIASGNYICRMDADDYSYPNRIEKQIKYLKENNVDLVGSNINYLLNMKCVNKTRYPLNSNAIFKTLCFKNCLTHPTWFCYKRVFDIVGKYRDFKACEDYDFLMRCALNNVKLANISDVLLDYTLSAEGISLSKSALQEVTARYLRKNYANGGISNFDLYVKFLESKKCKKKIKSLSRYLNIKNKRTYSRGNIFKFLFYSGVMMFHVKNFFYDLNCKIHLKRYLKQGMN